MTAASFSDARRTLADRLPASISWVSLLKIEVVLLAAFPPQLIIGPLGGFGAPARMFELLLLAAWLACLVVPGTQGLRPCTAVRKVVLLLWVSVIIAAFVMYHHWMPPDELSGTSRFFVTMACLTGVTLVAAEGLKTREDVLAVARTLVYAIGFMALVGVLQGQTPIDLVAYMQKIPIFAVNMDIETSGTRGMFTRPAGTALHPIEFGVVVAAFLGLAIWQAIYDDRLKRSWRWAVLFVVAFAVPISISRSALLVTVVILVFFLTGTTHALRMKGLAAVGAMLGFVFVAVPGLVGTLRGFVMLGEKDSSISSRTSDYAIVAPFLRESPWIGRGPGTYFPPKFETLDNQYLGTLVETGIIGLVALLVFLIAPAVMARGARRRSTDDGDRLFGQMLAASSVGLAVAAVTFDALSFPTYTRCAGLVLGLSGAWWMVARTKTGEVDGRGRVIPVERVLTVPSVPTRDREPALVGSGADVPPSPPRIVADAAGSATLRAL